MVTLPPGLKEIEFRAFESSGLEELIFEEGSELKNIGNRVSADIIFFIVCHKFNLIRFHTYFCRPSKVVRISKQ